jgi:hypothetical protein
MIAKLLKARRSRNARRRKSYRPFAERLEDRLLLAHGGFITLEFETELTSLNLTGGPYPMPLGPGWTPVQSEVSITLSSQRDVAPGPPSLGTACAFPRGIEVASAAAAGEGQCYGGDQPVDPNEWDNHEFVVDSFFDVFFDITVTDVDPGNNFAGAPDGASIQLNDNGLPDGAPMQSFYTAIFDKDAPNFGLIPPPPEASSPYIGHFLIEGLASRTHF